MTAYEPRVAGGDAGLPAARNQTPALAGTSTAASRRPERARTWRIEFPPKQKLLNANQRLHWYTKAHITKQLRLDAYILAKAAKLPRLERAHVEGVYEPPDRRKRDVANLYPSFKAVIDGALVDTGALPDDDSKHLVGPDMRLGKPYPGGRLVLIIHELPEETSYA